MQRRFFSALFAFLLLSSAADAAPREWWIQGESHLWVVAGGELIATLDVGPRPLAPVVSHDAHKVATASLGAADWSAFWGRHVPMPGAEGRITILRRPQLEKLAETSVVWNPGLVAFSSDDSILAVVSHGHPVSKEKKRIDPRITLMAADDGAVRSQIDLDQEVMGAWLAPTDRLFVALRRGGKDGPAAALLTVDIRSGEHFRSPLPGEPQRWLATDDDALQYLEIDDGVLAVRASGEIGDVIRAGEKKLLFTRLLDGNLFFLAGRTKKAGELVAIEDGVVVRRVETAPIDYLLADPEGSRLFVCAAKQISIHDLASYEKLAVVPFDGSFREVRLHPGGDRLYVNHIGDHVSVLDLSARREIAQFTSGRLGVKLKHAALEGVAAALTPYYMPPPTGWVAFQTLAFSSNGKYLYVYNSETKDVTVVATETHEVQTKIPTGPISWWPIEEGRYLFAAGWKGVTVIDAEAGAVVVNHDVDKIPSVFSPEAELWFLRHPLGLWVYRAYPFEKVLDLGKVEGPLMLTDEERFLVVGDGVLRAYDYDVRQMAQVAGVDELVAVSVLDPPPADEPATEESVASRPPDG